MSWNAQVWVKWKPSFPEKYSKGEWEWLKDWPEVKHAWSTMGKWDGCFWVNVDSPDKLEDFVWNKLRKTQWVDETWSVWGRDVWKQ